MGKTASLPKVSDVLLEEFENHTHLSGGEMQRSFPLAHVWTFLELQ